MFDPIKQELFMSLQKRRLSFYAMQDRKLKLNAIAPMSIGATHQDRVLPWIAQYTQGEFYLSDYSVGFVDDVDLFMFNLAFKR